MRRVKQLVPGRETIILVSASTSASSRWKGLLCGKLFKGNFGSSVFDERRSKRRHFEKLNPQFCSTYKSPRLSFVTPFAPL